LPYRQDWRDDGDDRDRGYDYALSKIKMLPVMAFFEDVNYIKNKP